MTIHERGGWRWRAWGPEGVQAIVLLHGFTGHGGFWAPLAEALGGDTRFIAPDLPGHGGSSPPGIGERLGESADRLADLLETLAPSPWLVAGYSLGGRLALHLAARHPERVARLLLIGASAGLEDPEARAARRDEDARRAEKLRREGLEAFLAEWEALPLFASQIQNSATRRAWLAGIRREQDAEGLARSLEAHGLGEQLPLQPLLPKLPVPTLWLAGAEDAKFAAIARELAPRMPRGEWRLVEGAGHNVPFDQPEKFLEICRSYFPISTPRGVLL